jgi:hypothetical protein
MMAFALTWILGGIITANIFASAGPVYYGRLNPVPDIYAEHMDLIRSLSASAHLEALVLQDSLWAAQACMWPSQCSTFWPAAISAGCPGLSALPISFSFSSAAFFSAGIMPLMVMPEQDLPLRAGGLPDL